MNGGRDQVTIRSRPWPQPHGRATLPNLSPGAKRFGSQLDKRDGGVTPVVRQERHGETSPGMRRR